MNVYLALLLLPLIVALGARRRALEPLAWTAVWVGLVLFIGLRREVGTDWDSYVLMAQRAGALPWWDAVTLSDAGFMLLAAAIAKLGLSVAVLHLVCAALFATGLLRFVRTQPQPALALLIAVPVLIAIVGLTVTRQSAAVGLFVWALALYSSGRRRLPTLMLGAAVLFHWTAILLLPLILLLQLRRAQVGPTLTAGALLGAGLAVLLLLPPLGERVADLAPSRGAAFRGGLTIFALFAWWALRGRLEFDDAERRIAAYLAALALFSLALLPVLSTAADRLGYYAIPLQMMVLTRAAVALAPRRAMRFAAGAFIVLLYAGMFSAWLALTGGRDCLTPYRSYLADPGAILDRSAERHRRTSPCFHAVRLPDPAGSPLRLAA